MCRPSRASSPSTKSSSRRTPWLATRGGRRGSWRRASTTNFFDSLMKELTGGEAEAQAGAGGGEGPDQVAAAQVGVEVEAGGAEVGVQGGGGGLEAGALTLQQLRSRKSSKRTGPIGDGQKSTTFLCQRWALLPQGRLFEKNTFLSFAKRREDRRQSEKRERANASYTNDLPTDHFGSL